MLTRRGILKIGAAISSSALKPTPRLLAQEQGRNALPPAIAGLKSMRDQVRPITTTERRGRIERARQLMADRKLDAIMLAGGSSVYYFTGIHWGNSERLFAVVLPARGEPFCVCPSFEEDRAREQINQGPLEGANVLTWHEDESPYQLLAAGLKSHGIVAGVLGVEEKTPYVFVEGVGQAAPALRLLSARSVTAGCRMIKSTQELELMSIANRATWNVYKAVYESLEPGMTQSDAAGLVSEAYNKVGFRGFATIEVGEYTAFPHGSIAPQVIHEGTVVMIDDGCTVDGYNSDITRTFVLGKPSDEMRKIFDIVHRAQSTALQAAKPGVACEAVDAAARKVIADAGYGNDYKYFAHRLGHGIGLDGHEWPYLVRGNSLPLAANMTFSDEPGIYIRGQFGVRLEDDMHTTEDGAQLFTPQSPSLEHPFA
ncbi:MAG: aminopeptidase P family protein [Acidobacteriaceae bacterium]|nr:aminopeptidase P family protein [Acidobacteriaceae bacterium]